MPITLHTEEAVEIPEQTELAVGRERDDFQRQIDNDVLALKLATAKAHWPKPEPGKLYHRYVVGSDDKGAMKSVIRRAATLYHVEAVFYKEAKTEAGHIAIKFHVARKLDKDNKPVKDSQLKADGTPTAEVLKEFAEANAS